MRRLDERTEALLWLVLTAAVLAAVCVCGALLPADAEGNFLNARLAPCREHLFGTDALGRDVFQRTLRGLSLSLAVGAAASLVSAVIAVLVSAAAALGSKYADAAASWLIDLVMSVPHTILIILVSFVLGRGVKGLLAGIAATHWCSLARLLRGEVMQLRAEPYVALSRKLGRSGGWILRSHLLPQLMPQLLVGLVLMLPHAILHEASISFLGFGLPPEQPAIGILLAESMRYLSAGMWWTAVLPGAALVLVVLLIDRAGGALRVLLAPDGAVE